MTPAEFKQSLSLLGWKQSDFARATDMHVMAVSRWVTGDAPIPGWVDLYLSALLALRHAAVSCGVAK